MENYVQQLISGGSPLTITNQTSAASMLAQLEDWLSSMEAMSSQPVLRAPNPKLCRFLHTYAKAGLNQVDLLAAHVDLNAILLSQEEQDKLDDLRDRAEELVDTFAWGLDGGETLNKLIDREMS